VNLVVAEREAGVAKRDDVAEALLDLAGLEERRLPCALRRHRCHRSGASLEA
jgi:hypothetical protein